MSLVIARKKSRLHIAYTLDRIASHINAGSAYIIDRIPDDRRNTRASGRP